MKNKSIVPVSYLLEAIQLQKEEEKTNKVEIDNDKSLNAIKNDDNNRYTKVIKEKNTVMSILFWELDKINNWKQASIK